MNTDFNQFSHLTLTDSISLAELLIIRIYAFRFRNRPFDSFPVRFRFLNFLVTNSLFFQIIYYVLEIYFLSTLFSNHSIIKSETCIKSYLQYVLTHTDL